MQRISVSHRTTWLRSMACCLSVFLSGIVAFGGTARAQESVTFDSWHTQCIALPTNRELRGRMPAKRSLPLPDFLDVQAPALQLLEQFQNGSLANASNWTGEAPSEEFFDIQRNYFTRPPSPFQPFAQRVILPADSTVLFHGDLHGDIRSLVSTLQWLNEEEYLDGFKLKKSDTYLVFLGDYVDRGAYGVEVMYTLMRLKLENPNHVLLARGNHEDFKMTASYGFLREGQMKYGQKFNPLPLWRLYDFLPVVIYLGVESNYIQCNHGGMEPGYNPQRLLTATAGVRYQLLGQLNQASFANDHPDWLRSASPATKRMADQKLADFRPQTPVLPNPIGFMWNDFFIFNDDPVIGFNPSRLAFNHGRKSTEYLLKTASSETAELRAVFRAHQHSRVPSPAMNRIVASQGVFRHWQDDDEPQQANADRATLQSFIEMAPSRKIPTGSVWTFNVSPDSVYGQGNSYDFDTVGILSTAKRFQDWRLKVINVATP